MEFFTNPEDVSGWVKSQSSADEAATKIIEIIGRGDEQDIVDTCRSIYEDKNEEASEVLFGVLASNNLAKRITADKKGKMIKEAQSQRMGLYNDMEKRICPKLPRNNNIISTWNCREHCLDSMVLDDDPDRVYCKEALWRRHVMDKFSREFKNKEGKWVGGYINERFQVMQDDGGNPMELANGERTRKPRSHQYSTERRLEEARGEKTKSITASVQDNGKTIKLASKEKYNNENDEKIYGIFNDIIEMNEAGLSYEDILTKVSEHYSMSITSVASIHKMAMQKLQVHSGTKYAYNSAQKMEKTSGLESVESPSGGMLTVDTISTQSGMIQPNTKMEVVDLDAGVFRVDGQEVVLSNPMDVQKMIPQDIQDASEEVGLFEDSSEFAEMEQRSKDEDVNYAEQPEDFPINEV